MSELDLTCDAVQEGLSLLRTGGAALTDWALLERHARQCESCRTREQVEATAIAAPRASIVHQPRYWLEKLQGESRLRMTSFMAWTGPQLAIARGRSGQAAVSVIQAALAAATRLVEALAGLGALLSQLGPLAAQLLASLMQAGVLAATRVSEIAGRVGHRSSDRLTRALGPGGLDRVTRGVGSGLSVLSTAGRRAGRATTEAGASMVPHAQAFGGQLRRGLATAATTLGQGAELVLAAGRAGDIRGGTAVRRLAALVRVATDRAAVKVSGVSQATSLQARALVASIRSVVAYAARPPRLTAGTAMVGLVILIAATPLWWPRTWHVERVVRLAAPDNAAMTPATGVQVVQPPLDRKSAEPPVAARLIRTSRPVPSSLGLADGVARSERNADRSDSLAHPTGSTATSGAGASREPGRRQEPARTPRVTADAPDDASAAVDWLLDNTRARR